MHAAAKVGQLKPDVPNQIRRTKAAALARQRLRLPQAHRLLHRPRLG
jgi:hypothetical protein